MTSMKSAAYFNPLPPHGGRLPKSRAFVVLPRISIHSLRMEGDMIMYRIQQLENISIHSLRMEGDSAIVQCALFQHISIHSLRMEGDTYKTNSCTFFCKFQSTPSAWRET